MSLHTLDNSKAAFTAHYLDSYQVLQEFSRRIISRSIGKDDITYKKLYYGY